MAHWFVRHQGKVFGPFAASRVLELVGAQKFDATAECANSWEGPWSPLSASLDQIRRPAAPAPPTEASKPPPASTIGSGVPSDASPLVATVDSAGLCEPGFFDATSWTPSGRPPAATNSDTSRLVKSATNAVAVMLAAASVLAGLMFVFNTSRTDDPRTPSGESRREVLDDPVSVATRNRRNAEDSGPPASPQPVAQRLDAPPDVSDTARLEPPNAATALEEPAAIPRAEPPASYDKLPAEAMSAIKSLRTLRAVVDIGVSFEHYRNKLQELLPEVQIFLDSRDATALPELAAVLRNATDCYTTVRTIWSDSVSSPSEASKRDATRLLEAARDPLWKVARQNVALAYSFASEDASVRAAALGEFRADPQKLVMKPTLDAITASLPKGPVAAPPVPETRTVAASRQEPLSATAEPRPAVDPRSAPPRIEPPPPRQQDRIEVGDVRRIAEALKGQNLEKEEADQVEDVLDLTAPRKWALRNLNTAKGTIITIWPDRVLLKTNEGEGRVLRDQLSPASKGTVERIERLYNSLHDLQTKLAGEANNPP